MFNCPEKAKVLAISVILEINNIENIDLKENSFFQKQGKKINYFFIFNIKRFFL